MDTSGFAAMVALLGGVVILALLSNRACDALHVPPPLVVLLGAAAAATVFPSLHAVSAGLVQQLVTVAFVFVLFDGGLQIGWRRFRSAAAPILLLGVLGTFATAAAAAWFAHVALGLDWYASLLIATAVSPTDPAVVFSVLGHREMVGRSGAVLEGEAGANDPVGIALMVSVIKAGGIGVAASGHILGEFALQMGVGVAVGAIGGLTLLWFTRAVSLPLAGLYPLRTAACALVLYGVATLAHGSGFLAVFVAGILMADADAPFKLEVDRFHGAMAGLGEIVAFAVLGLTIDVSLLTHLDVLVPGLLLGLVVSAVVRPALAGLCLVRSGLTGRERAFVLFSGLKGAVPILLGSYIVATDVAHAERLYGIVVIVVLFSMVVQAGLVPTVARLLGLSMRPVAVTPLVSRAGGAGAD